MTKTLLPGLLIAASVFSALSCEWSGQGGREVRWENRNSAMCRREP